MLVGNPWIRTKDACKSVGFYVHVILLLASFYQNSNMCSDVYAIPPVPDILAPQKGLEPLTPGLEDLCSNSY